MLQEGAPKEPPVAPPVPARSRGRGGEAGRLQGNKPAASATAARFKAEQAPSCSDLSCTHPSSRHPWRLQSRQVGLLQWSWGPVGHSGQLLCCPERPQFPRLGHARTMGSNRHPGFAGVQGPEKDTGATAGRLDPTTHAEASSPWACPPRQFARFSAQWARDHGP